MNLISRETIKSLRNFDTPAIANAVETFNIRLRNEGFIKSPIINRCRQEKPMVGFAFTISMRSSSPPVRGRFYPDRNDWWEKIENISGPIIVVIKDDDANIGSGSLAGATHGGIFKALGAEGIITNGSVRDIGKLKELGFSVFSSGIAPSHSYAHITGIGDPVRIGDLKISTGDLLHGDENGIVSIPLELAPKVPEIAEKISNQEKNISGFCNSENFSVKRLRRLINRFDGK